MDQKAMSALTNCALASFNFLGIAQESVQNYERIVDTRQNIHYRMVVDLLGTTFAALADPTRRAMIERLSRGPASVHGLTEPFALSQQMISKHIAYLVRARIVIKTKRGRESVCTLRPEAIRTVSDWAMDYRRFWEESLDKLDVVVNRMKKSGG